MTRKSIVSVWKICFPTLLLACALLFGQAACDPGKTPQNDGTTGQDASDGNSTAEKTAEPIPEGASEPTQETTPEVTPEPTQEATPEKTKTVYSFPGEKVPCKPNPTFEALKPILEGGKNNPTGRGEQSGIYDPCNGRVVVFGGNDYQPQQCADFGPKRFKGDTWVYVPSYKNWIRLKTSAAPQARGRHAAAFDLSRKLIYIIGGRYRAENATGNYQLFSDLWAFDVNTDTWKEIPTKGNVPSARTNSAIVYDDLNDQLVLFGGSSSPSGLAFNALNDTYLLDLKTYTWTKVNTTRAPAARLFHSLVMDGNGKRVLLYGGGGNNAFTGPFLNDVWAFDLTKKEWSQVWRPSANDPGPPARINTTLVEDRSNARIIMFAGHDDTAIGHRNDVWTFQTKLHRWEMKKAGDTGTGSGCSSFCRCSPDFVEVDANSPERRQYHTFAPLIGEKKVILFGGKTDCGYIDDTWYFNYENFAWEKINDASQGEACKRTGRANCTELCY